MVRVNCRWLWAIMLLICRVSALNPNELKDLYVSLNDSNLSREEFFALFNIVKTELSFDALKATADIYYYGNEYCIPNYELALEWYLKAYAINQRDSDVLFMIGLLYGYGIGCDIDFPKGLMFTLASARLGNIKAQNAMSFYYQYGIGVEKNCMYSRAYLLSSVKKSLKNISAKDAVATRKPVRLSVKSSELEKTKSQQEALEYYEYSARGGDASASILLAQLYYFGTEGTDPDYEKARIHFINSLNFGHEAAFGYLGQIYYRGEGVEPDFEKAYEYFYKGAERNIPSALNGMGLLYWHGQIVEKDLDSAEAYFKRAADLKYPEAYYNYAMILLEQPAVFTTEKVFQNFLAAVKSGYVIANFEIVKRYLKTENSCSTSIAFLKQILDKGDSLEVFKHSDRYYAKGFEDQALSRYIILASQGYEIANYNAAFILERTKELKHLKRATFYYYRSAIMNNSASRKKVGDAYFRLGDPVAAVAHYVLSARSDKPDPEALFNLGLAYETGVGLNLDLWSAMDMYSVSLSHGKSGKLAISIVMIRLRVKIFVQSIRKYFYPSFSKYERKNIKARKEADKTLTMLTTLVLICIIYWYFNYRIRPEARALNNVNQNNRDTGNYEYNVQNSGSSGSSQSDSTDSLSRVREYRFNNSFSESKIDSDEDEVD